MTRRTLPIAALFLAITIPAAAQETREPPVRAEVPEGKRMFVQAPLGYRGKEVPQPIGSSQDWVTNADYPLGAWRNREEGLVQYDLAIDAQGQVTGCTITYSTATPELEAHTCRLLRDRARFEPAEDKDGKPRASVSPGEFMWQRREPEYPGSFTVKVAFILDARGQQIDCRIIERSGMIPPEQQRALDKRPCPSNLASRGVPYRDAEGGPVARTVTLTYAIDVSPEPSGN